MTPTLPTHAWGTGRRTAVGLWLSFVLFGHTSESKFFSLLYYNLSSVVNVFYLLAALAFQRGTRGSTTDFLSVRLKRSLANQCCFTQSAHPSDQNEAFISRLLV